MPISIKDFDEKGTAPTRTSGFGGKIGSGAMELLNSKNLAFSLDEVAEATETDLKDGEEVKILMNVLYNLRTSFFNGKGKQTRTAKITMKAYEDVKHYRIATPEEIEEQNEIAKDKYEAKKAEKEAEKEPEDKEAPADDGEEKEPEEDE